MKFIYRGCYILNVFQLVFITTFFLAAYLCIFRYKLQDNEKLTVKGRKFIPKYPGEMGTPVHLPLKPSKIIKHLIYLGWQKHKFNKYVSDLIPLNRSLPDARDECCKQPGRFREHLPVTDVIICFHNEAWSTLLRTVHSVINRSPDHLIGQIILVDDDSNEAHLKESLDRYFYTFPKVKIVRALKRQGIARARVMGMKYSTAAVLTYLDSHCECMEGWLEPLLDRIARNPTTVVAPFIDFIDKETFEYIAPSLRDEKFIGGFKWNLGYTWFQYSTKGKNYHKNEMDPVPTPTIAGGLFSIDRKFFEYLGTYDSGFEYWGAENLELSFKTWMCGGRLEAVFCSRVGHVFRVESPHNYPYANAAIISNSVRLAKVWLDDYAKIFYASWGKEFNEIAVLSDVNDNKLFRKKLGCKSFKWYLENVYPEKFVPIAFGAFVQIYKNVCLDAEDRVGYINIAHCHNLGENQFWMIGDLGEIRKDETCLTAKHSKPVLLACTKVSDHQLLHFDNQTHRIFSKKTKQCLTFSNNSSYIYLKKCQKRSWRQNWNLI